MNELINDEKHYVTINNYLKSLYHKKFLKLLLMVIFLVLIAMERLVIVAVYFVLPKVVEILRVKKFNH